MSATASYIWIALAAILALLDVWAIVSVWRSDKPTSTKAFWALGISMFPVLGLVYWGIAGPRGIRNGPTSPEHSKG